MTGKEFFGKLLSNRQNTPEPWDRDDSGDGRAAAELVVAPLYNDETDEGGAVGGDGLSSPLPEVRPSSPRSSEFEPQAETPDSSIDDEPPIHWMTSPEPLEISAEAHDPEAIKDDAAAPPSSGGHATKEVPASLSSSNGRYVEEEIPTAPSSSNGRQAEEEIPAAPSPSNGRHAEEEIPTAPPPSNGRQAEEEIPTAPPPSNGRQAEKEIPAAPTPSNGRHAEEEIPAALSPSNGRHADAEIPAAQPPSNSRHSNEEVPAAPPPSNGRHADEEILPAPPPSNSRQTDEEMPKAPLSSNGRHKDEDVPAAPPSSNGRSADPSLPAATSPNNGRHTAPAEAAGPGPKIERKDDADTKSAVPSRSSNAAPGAAGASESAGASASHAASVPAKGRQADDVAPPAKTPARERTAAGQSHRGEQSQNRARAQAPTAARVAERKESDSSKGRSNAPTSVQGDVELKGIKDRVVIRLLQKNLVSEAHVKAALRERNKDNLKATLWRIVAHQHGVDREAIYREAALTYAFVERKLEEKDVDLEFVRQVADVFPEKRRNRLIELRVVPVGYEFEQQTQMLRVVFLTHDPSLPAVRELMQELNLERYELQYAPELVVKDLLAKAFPRKNEYLERMSEDPLAYDLGMSYEEEKGELIDEEALEAEINRSSLINLFEAALVESVHKGASDIHIYPNAKRQVEIHFRIDGRLMLWHLEDKVHPESLLAVIKDNSMNVDRFERDMAQDGFIQRKVDDTLIRYRVSIMPIATAQQGMHAESIVIRVLDDRKVLTDLSQLGLLKGAIERFDMAIRQPHGMVILTGPTGSGKSTTLVAALHQVVNPEINVLTVEDPVEYIIPSVRQIKLNHKLNLEQALRSILRHDPDVVMVGEMRDRPTAELAIKLANTGHLTFSTLHTNDAPSAVSRLYKMGVEPFLIAYAINLVVAQRLIRSLCPTCKVVDGDPDPVLLDRLGFTRDELATTTLYKPSGDPTCKTCKGNGYKGRRAISEALYFSRAIRHLVVEADTKIDEDALREAARKEGMLTLQDSAREVVKMGATSVDEMMRVTATEE